MIVSKQMIKPSLLIFFLFIALNAMSLPVKLTGKASDYAHQSIELSMFHDYISEENIKLGTIHFDAHGSFQLEVDISQICLCRADFDGYQGLIYLEPGKTYELMFPPKRTQTASQKKNPFVKPEPIWLGIKNPAQEDLNVMIQQFETAFTAYENKYFNQIFHLQSASLVDTVMLLLDKEFPKTSHSFFESHKGYRKGSLEFALHQGKTEAFAQTYFRDSKPVYNLGTYSSLFNQVFLNYFTLLENTPRDPAIKKMIHGGQLQQLDAFFQKELNYNKELAHWVLLKSMKDAYYSRNFSKATLLKMLDQVKSAGWSSYEQKTAQLIKQKLTYLASGTAPPAINLKDLTGRTVRFSDYPDKYVYLHFTDPKNPICRQHLDALKSIGLRYKDKVSIINVIPSGADFKNEPQWAGVFTTTDNDINATYKVKTVPNSFLISKDGKLLLSPAPNPIDGLDRQLGQILKSDHFKELKKANGQNVR